MVRPPKGQISQRKDFWSWLADFTRNLNREPRALGCLWLFALFWNGLVWFGIWSVNTSFGSSSWKMEPFALFALPFVAVGLGLLALCVLPLVTRVKLGQARIFVHPPKVRPGETFSVTYRQRINSDILIKRMVARFIFQESATYTRGTSESTETQNFVLDEKVLRDRTLWRGGTNFEQTVHFTVPKQAMHTFVANRNKLQYFVTFDLEIERWTDYHDAIEVTVLSELPKGDEGENGA